jgi:hypothetical protein
MILRQASCSDKVSMAARTLAEVFPVFVLRPVLFKGKYSYPR